MPLVRISVPAHLDRAQILGLADAVHEALVETCGVPANDRFQLISRFAEGTMIVDPSFPDVERTADASIVEITFLEGRSSEMKQQLYRHIAHRAVGAGFRSDDILVALTENALIDWSMGRGLAYDGNGHAR